MVIIKILIYSEATLPFFVGGGEIFLKKMCNYFQNQGHNIVVVSNKVDKKEKVVSDEEGIIVYRVPPAVKPPSYYGWPKGRLEKIYFVLKKLSREILKTFFLFYIFLNFKPDIFILNGVSITVIPSFLPGSTRIKAWKFAKKIFRRKVLLIVHAINPPSGITLKNTISDVIASDTVVCVEKWMKDLLSNYIGDKKCFWIHNGVDTNLFRYRKNVKGYNVLFVGRLSEDHGLDILLEALSIVSQDFPNINLRVVGDGPQKKQYIDLMRKLGLEKNVVFRGKIDNENMWKEYHWSNIVVNPVRVVCIGISTLEAMSCGRIVIKSSDGTRDDVIQEGINGFLFKMNDSYSLSEKIKEVLLLGEDSIEKISLKARETIDREFDENKIFERYESVILRLLPK